MFPFNFCPTMSVENMADILYLCYIYHSKFRFKNNFFGKNWFWNYVFFQFLPDYFGRKYGLIFFALCCFYRLRFRFENKILKKLGIFLFQFFGSSSRSLSRRNVTGALERPLILFSIVLYSKMDLKILEIFLFFIYFGLKNL